MFDKVQSLAEPMQGPPHHSDSIGHSIISDGPFAQSYFTHPAFVAANHRVELARVVQPQGRPSRNPRLFEIDGDVARHIGRLEPMTSSEIAELCETLFFSSDVRRIVFEDIVLEDNAVSLSAPFVTQHFRYQANWCRALAPGAQYLSKKRSKEIERRLRQLVRLSGSKPRHLFRRARSDDIDLVADMSRRCIESRGGLCRFSDLKKKRLMEICEKLGYSSMLMHNERVISGSIICITGYRAYCILTGYDAEFRRFSPGLYMAAKTLEACAALGCTEANLLWGDGELKEALGAQRQPLDTIVISRNRWQLLHPSGLEVIYPYVVPSAKRYMRSLLQR